MVTTDKNFPLPRFTGMVKASFCVLSGVELKRTLDVTVSGKSTEALVEIKGVDHKKYLSAFGPCSPLLQKSAQANHGGRMRKVVRPLPSRVPLVMP